MIREITCVLTEKTCDCPKHLGAIGWSVTFPVENGRTLLRMVCDACGATLDTPVGQLRMTITIPPPAQVAHAVPGASKKEWLS